VVPGNASLEDKEYPGEDRTIRDAGSASPGDGMCRKDWLDNRPKLVRNSGKVHPGRLRLSAAHYCSAL